MPALTRESGELVARKRELTLGSYRDAYAKTGVSIGTWERIERGESVQRRSLLRATSGLGWGPAALNLLLQGLNPDEVRRHPSQQDDRQRRAGVADELEARLKVVEDLLSQIRESVADLLREEDRAEP